jgi:DNA-binding transcriptional MocR family regulator
VQVQFSDRSARGLAATIEAAIRARDLAPGDPLPSVRDLAADADVSPATAAATLAELRRRGLIVTRERRRSFVSPRPPIAVAGAGAAVVPAGVRDLASGHPDPELLPDLLPALSRLDPGRRSYDGDPVIAPLLEVARADFAASGVEADRVCLASGALDGVERVLGAHLRPGDRVAVEDPCYSALLDLVRAVGLEPVPIAIDELGLLPRQLGAVIDAVDAVLLTPRAQNPTGAALDAARRDELARLLGARRGLLVIEDDHQGPIAGAEGLSVVGGQERWARIRSVAKALGPDVRLAYIAGDEETISRVEGRLSVGPGWVSEILQRLVVDLASRKRVQAGLTRAARIYASRREALLTALAARGIAATGRSGFNVWIPVPDEGAVIAALLERRWAVAPGAPFRIQAPPAVRATTATLLPDEARAFAADVAATLAPGRRRRAA